MSPGIEFSAAAQKISVAYSDPVKERAREKAKRQRQRERDPEAYRAKMAARKRRNKERNPQADLERKRRYRERHKDRLASFYREYMPKWKAANPGKTYYQRKGRLPALRVRDPEAWREKLAMQRRNKKARVKGRGRLSWGLTKRLLVLQRGKCAACAEKMATYHRDHIVPLALGGLNVDTNIQLLCPPCNMSKGAKPPVEFMQSRGFLL